MKVIQLQFDPTCLIDKQKLVQTGKKLIPEIERIRNSLKRGYDVEHAAFNLVHDRQLTQTIQAVVQEKKLLSISTIVVVGIGGSNLGTLAVQEAVQGKYHNSCNKCIKILYADTVDSDYIAELLAIVELELKQGKNILLNVISKSGTTIETIANFEIFLQLLKQYRPDYGKYIVVTTDNDSVLWHLARAQQWTILEIPKLIGGRYSVLSAVGLFPLLFVGIDIDQLREGARILLQSCLESSIENNPAALSALIRFTHYQNKININDFFAFSVSLESFGKWYRQLMAESVGKAYTKNDEQVHVGITPTVSIGSIDLHSVGQLNIEGPVDKFTLFATVNGFTPNVVVPKLPEFNDCVAHIQGKPLSVIMDAIVRGTKKAYQEKQRPFCSLILPDKSALIIGQCLQLFMCEVVYLGYLFDINPFDQPGVELYKQQTREILAYE